MQVATLAGQMQQQGSAQTGAQLNGGTFATGTPQTNLLAALQAISNGSMRCWIDNHRIDLTQMNFIPIATLAQAATVMQQAMGNAAAITWQAGPPGYFRIVTRTVGPNGSVGFCQNMPSGVAIAHTCLLLSSDGGNTVAGTSPLGPQWVQCDGRLFRADAPMLPLPHSGISTGTGLDYIRNVGRHAGGRPSLRGRFGKSRIPYDPSGLWYISIADHSGEATLASPPTPMNPPPFVR